MFYLYLPLHFTSVTNVYTHWPVPSGRVQAPDAAWGFGLADSHIYTTPELKCKASSYTLPNWLLTDSILDWIGAYDAHRPCFLLRSQKHVRLLIGPRMCFYNYKHGL